MPKTFDVVINGAGPVGMALAIHLKQHGKSVLIIGPQPQPAPAMTFAIKENNLSFLHDLGLRLTPGKAESMHLSSPPNKLNISAHSAGKPMLFATIAYNQLLHQCQRQIIRENITWIQEKPLSFQNNILSTAKHSIQAPIFVAADGAKSWLRSHTNISVKHYDYQQHAHIATLSHHEKSTEAFQRFSDTGTLACLPMHNTHQSALIWSCNQETHQYIQRTGIHHALKSSFPKDRAFIHIKHHQSIPLKASLAKQFYQNNIVLIGSALHHVHPIAGIGFNLSLGDIRELTQTICYNRNLRHYEKKRRIPHIQAHMLTHTTQASRNHPKTRQAVSSILSQWGDYPIIPKNLLRLIELID